MTFESFYPGTSYLFQWEAAKQVADHPGGTYNPLILSGPCGVGKTHLLSAIAHQAASVHPEFTIVQLSAECFVNELVAALCNGDIEAFRQKFSSADMLLIEHFETVAGKETTQEELFCLFNHYLQQNKQLVLSINTTHADTPFS